MATKTRKVPVRRIAPEKRGTPTVKPAPAKCTCRGKASDRTPEPSGATMAVLIAATDWQPHSMHDFLSGTVERKLGLRLVSTRADNGIWRYSLDRAGRGR